MNTGKLIAFTEAIGTTWSVLLSKELEKPYFKELEERLIKEKKEGYTIQPNKLEIFQSFRETSISKIKVIIVGQEPGMPSKLDFKNALLEDLNKVLPSNLNHIANQGVFISKSILTVRDKTPNSHKGWGWEQFTLEALGILYNLESPKVWILWGKEGVDIYDKVKQSSTYDSHHQGYLPSNNRLVINAIPGSKPFSKTNIFLKEKGLDPICWDLPF